MCILIWSSQIFVYISNMLKRYIVILLITILVVIFAIQNVEMVNIKLWFFEFDTSLALLIILTFAAGTLITLAFALYEIGRGKRRISELEDQQSRNHENASDITEEVPET